MKIIVLFLGRFKTKYMSELRYKPTGSQLGN